MADKVRVTLIDRSASFVFGFSKLEVIEFYSVEGAEAVRVVLPSSRRASPEMAAEKEAFGSTRRQRWFGQVR